MSTPTPGDPLDPTGDPEPVTSGDPLEAHASDPGSGTAPEMAPDVEPGAVPDVEPDTAPETEPMAAYSAAAGEGTPRRLTRSRSERVFGGVAGGLGRYFDVDPVVFRIGFAAATLAGGLGVFAYLAALLFVPDEGADRSPAGRSRLLTIAGAVVLSIAALAALDNGPGLFFGPLVPLAILGGVGYGTYLAVRGRSDGRPVTFSRLAGWVGLGAGAMLAAFALAFASAWATAEGSGAVIAALVIAIGGLLVGSATRSRGARWLALPALLLAVPLGVVAAADVSFDGGFGERSYRPASVADLPRDGYRLGAGELVVDLRDVDLPAGRETVLDLRLGMGSAEVLVSEDVCVITDTRVGGGYVNLRGRDSGGLDVDFLVRADTTAAPRLLVRGDVGLGALEIIDEPYDSFDGRRRFDRDASDGFNFGDTTVEDGACNRVEIASAG